MLCRAHGQPPKLANPASAGGRPHACDRKRRFGLARAFELADIYFELRANFDDSDQGAHIRSIMKDSS